MNYLSIGIGGVFGSLLRYFFSLSSTYFGYDEFPYGTLFANLLGAYLIGLFTRKITELGYRNKRIILAIGTGGIGSFTTMSAFSVETVRFIERNEWLLAFTYIIISAIGGLLLAFFGYYGLRKAGGKG